MEVYEKKVRKGFHFFDLDKNGFVTREEFVQIADVICSLGKTSESEREETRKQYTKWSDALFPEGQVSEEIFWERSKNSLSKLPEVMWHENILTYGNTFERLDSNKDGFLSPEELRLYYKAFGYGDDYDIDQIFRALDDNNDGLISKDEFTHAAATYWSNTPGYEYFYDPVKKEMKL